MKNLLTQWDTEEENRKILSVFGEKTSQPWRETGEENQKILSVFGEKTSQPWRETGEENRKRSSNREV